ncbi:MAG: PQQ-like beta-propeller repeat protein [Prolixibacteraceae bacterium]|jgi:outer membrane protein assembly factor BamB|nr:PQQ-like beta-propeller repeat protein [Prolixibacteraceae bacterium]MBT6005423.1 PQQ-like beta-propeller repeat protein [Prolixibacteraceae bacterium]MBT6999035.1 PQQ-like beta-propeller repeat protein [Prolixibacteraceae bacterium]MBT7394466.1 PQQ-like beta-propeller repeat protein [Prolixibacteraceae bacterium]
MKFISTILFILISVTLFSQEIVEFRGDSRSGVYNETGLLKVWPETGPELFLKIEGVGKGFSQPVFIDGEIFISGIKEDTIDILSAYNLKGEMLWETSYGRSWTNTYIDSRSTPTFENGKLFVISGMGEVNCIDAETGAINWQVNAPEKFSGEIYKHGDSESPLLINNAVLYTTGGEKNTLVALDKNDGSLIWKTKSLGGGKSYASPVLIHHNGQDFIIAQTSENIISIHPETGEIMWSYNLIQYHLHKSGVGAQTNPPIYYKNELFATSGYNHPGIKFALSDDGRSVEVKWKNDTIDTHIGGVVLVEGNLYGSNWQSNSKGKWTSVNWETGRTNWETQWENKGSIISSDDLLYLYEEKRGNIALVEPTSDSLKIISTFKVDHGAGPHWAHPAIYNGKLFVRHGDVLMIYNIKDE